MVCLAGRKARGALLLFGLVSLFVLLAITRGVTGPNAVASRVRALGGWTDRKPSDFSKFLKRIGWRKDYGAIRSIEIFNAQLTSDDFEMIGRQSELEVLRLCRTNITDADLRHFSELKHLRILNLKQTTLTGAGLRELNSLNELDSLVLSDTRVSDDAIEEVVRFKNLGFVNLTGTNISAVSLSRFGTLEQLRIVQLRRTQVKLLDFMELPYFGRRGHVLGGPPLTGVELSDDEATPQDLTAVRKRFPHVEFHVEPLTFPVKPLESPEGNEEH